jgi:hypothetical protein
VKCLPNKVSYKYLSFSVSSSKNKNIAKIKNIPEIYPSTNKSNSLRTEKNGGNKPLDNLRPIC